MVQWNICWSSNQHIFLFCKIAHFCKLHFFQISEKEQSEIIWIKDPPPPPLSNLYNSTKKEVVWERDWIKISEKNWEKSMRKLHLNIGLDTKYSIIMQLCRNQKFPVKDCWLKSWTLLPASMKQSRFLLS